MLVKIQVEWSRRHPLEFDEKGILKKQGITTDMQAEFYVDSADLPDKAPTGEDRPKDYKRNIVVHSIPRCEYSYLLVGAWTNAPGTLIADNVELVKV